MGAATFSIVVVKDDGVATYPLPDKGRLTIGRAPGCDIHIDDRSVSRSHAVLHLDERFQLEDLGSANGSRVCGLALAPNEPALVYPDDAIDVGGTLLFIQYRALAQRLKRICTPTMFDVRLADERCRPPRDEGGIALMAMIEVDGALDRNVVPLLLRAELSPGELLTSRAASRYELLLLEDDAEEAQRRVGRMIAGLAARGAAIRSHYVAPLKRTEGAAPTRPERALAHTPAGVDFDDEPMLHVLSVLERIAESTDPVLLVGERGVGKRYCAEILHRLSPRAAKPFLHLDGANLDEPLEPALARARSGTILFDDLGGTPRDVQAALLDVLLRGDRDTRFVYSAHDDLDELFTAGRVRPELHARLKDRTLLVPPFRERPRESVPPAGGITDEDLKERDRIAKALAANFGNQRRTADDLGISRSALFLRMERLGLRATR